MNALHCPRCHGALDRNALIPRTRFVCPTCWLLLRVIQDQDKLSIEIDQDPNTPCSHVAVPTLRPGLNTVPPRNTPHACDLASVVDSVAFIRHGDFEGFYGRIRAVDPVAQTVVVGFNVSGCETRVTMDYGAIDIL